MAGLNEQKAFEQKGTGKQWGRSCVKATEFTEAREEDKVLSTRDSFGNQRASACSLNTEQCATTVLRRPIEAARLVEDDVFDAASYGGYGLAFRLGLPFE
jgi:hypothetical protein